MPAPMAGQVRLDAGGDSRDLAAASPAGDPRGAGDRAAIDPALAWVAVNLRDLSAPLRLDPLGKRRRFTPCFELTRRAGTCPFGFSFDLRGPP